MNRVRNFVTTVRHAPDWVADFVLLRRWQIFLFCFAVGCMLAGLVLLNDARLDDAADARARDRAFAAQQRAELHKRDEALAAAIHRIKSLESPTPAQRRRALNRLLEAITPEQARRLSVIIMDGTNPFIAPGSPQNPPQRGPTGSPRGAPSPSSPPELGGGPPAPPPGSPPAQPGPPPGVPPDVRPPDGLVPPIDLPPVDPDGPGGQPPIIDPPPIVLPLGALFFGT